MASNAMGAGSRPHLGRSAADVQRDRTASAAGRARRSIGRSGGR